MLSAGQLPPVEFSRPEVARVLIEAQRAIETEAAVGAGALLESPDVPGAYSFPHALIREALYEDMSATRRARIHRQVGEAQEAGGQAPLGELARHFTLAAGREDLSRQLWGLLAFTLWFERYGVQAENRASARINQ